MPWYHFQRIEPKWQAYWEAHRTFRAPDLDPGTLRPADHAGALASYAGLWDPIAAFGAWAAALPPGPAVPPGRLANAVAADKEGLARTAQPCTAHAPGALLPPP